MNNTKKLTALAMLTSMAFIVGAAIRLRGTFAIAPFLTYDPKDVVILMGGFMFGPVAAALMSVAVALLEMVTVSDSGIIGALMNALSSASFTVTAALVYSKKRNLTGAVIGLVVGSVAVTVIMLLWNVLIIPLYMPFVTREAAVGLLLPAIVPFNLIKSALNAALAVMLYKVVTSALRNAGLYKEVLPETGNAGNAAASSKRINIIVMVISGVVAAALVAALFIIRSVE